MACNNDPCTQDPCDTYDNCGCTIPTTSNCVTYTGDALEAINLQSGETEEDALVKIDEQVGLLQDDKGKVLINGDDTCPDYLFDKLQEGTNISFAISGTGCAKRLVIHAVDGGTPVDVNAKVTASDTTSGYLNTKLGVGTYLTKTVISPGGNEVLRFDVNPTLLVSSDSGNQITIGADGGLKTSYSSPTGAETKIISGVGIILSGTGTLADPYVVSSNPSIQVARPCFDGIWRAITLVATGNPNVVYSSGAPEYRYRYDGTLEFRGNITYTVAFGAYSSGNRKYTVTIGNIPTTCLTSGEQAGTFDLKGINYIDIPQASADQIVQQYGYIIRKSTQNIILELQSSFTNATSKSLVVSFDGAVSHPTI